MTARFSIVLLQVHIGRSGADSNTNWLSDLSSASSADLQHKMKDLDA
jgi:hypothetical protein